MKQIQEVFQRYEKKYLLTQQTFRRLMTDLEEKMSVDEYGEHTICNIYFDTSNYELIRTSLEKPAYKEKLRLRSYGVPSRDDTVFVELKKKVNGIVYKRRQAMPLWEAEDYLYQHELPACRSQIQKELNWVTRRYQLLPAAYVAYDRIALFGKQDPELRITFDSNIRCRSQLLYLEQGAFGESILQRNQLLMEVKIADSMPVWMSQLFTKYGILPASFSKYGSYYQRTLSQQLLIEGGVICA